jgi:hypothetical protein
MRLARPVVGVLVAATFGMLGGCGGGGADVQSNIHTQTEGQQLMDLKKALDAGAISKDEYDRMRVRIIEGR